MTVTVRPETPGDIDAVRALHDAAFGQPTEGAIVDAIRKACPAALSLVAVEDDVVVGHILFSPVTVPGTTGGMGLAPMAVIPDRQRRGVGSLLVREGLGRLEAAGCPVVIVLGHPEYYPRFGFRPASEFGLACPWKVVPEEAFLACVLDESKMVIATGTVRYRPEFDITG